MIYITGHKKPDTDSIVSAISYSYLKNAEGYDTIPIRISELNRETEFVLNYFNVDIPKKIEDISPRAKDIKMDEALLVKKNDSIYEVLEKLKNRNLKNAYVVDEKNKMLGMVTMYDIMDEYFNFATGKGIDDTTELSRIEKVLDGNLVENGSTGLKTGAKLVAYAMQNLSAKKYIKSSDVILVGDRYEARLAAIEMKVSLLILVGGIDLENDLKELASKNKVPYIVTELDTIGAARRLPLSSSIENVMKKDDITYFYSDQEIDEIEKVMKSTRFRQYPVLNRSGEVMGTISRYHLLNLKGHDLIMVDHNEKSQSIEGIETARVLEIIDHHRVQSVPTSEPIYFRNEPVGSTATIIAKLFLERLVKIPPHIAGLLMAAIISDTLLFRSPTTTETDKKIMGILEEVSGENRDEFAIKMFKEGTSLQGKTIPEILNIDQKKFTIEGEYFLVSQVFTMDDEYIDKVVPEISLEMNKIKNKEGAKGFITLVTNILKESSKVFIDSEYIDFIKEALNTNEKSDVFVASGLLSRKKQMIPALNQAVLKALRS